jgi:transcriptional regulator with XRE-family HTH domain
LRGGTWRIMEGVMDRDGLADFLRRRREALQPEDVGLAPTRRRRTAGLRREEVAALAHMSTDFYTRLEQARGSRPSAETVAALASALRLSLDERDHLHRLAGHVAPPRHGRSDVVSLALVRVLDRLDTPAHVVDDLGVTLRQNPLSEALLGRHTQHRGLRRSVFYRWFTDPAERERFLDHDVHSRSYVAALRAAYGHAPDDPAFEELVTALLRESPEFAQLWERHEVGSRTDTLKRFAHPLVGELTLDCQILVSENQVERLVIFTALPGSEDADRLRLLGVVGTQVFGGAD